MQPRAPGQLPRVVIVGTGGTIAAAAAAASDTTDYQLAHGIETVLAAVPAMHEVAQIRAEQFVNIPSQEIDDAVLLRLAQRVHALLASDDVDALVITHGTDTMEETAYFLGLVVKSAKPVVLTGSMRPATALSADGPLNLLQAVQVAASAAAVGQGVLLVLAGRIVAARDAAKTHTTSTEAFSSCAGIGTVVGKVVDFHGQELRMHTLQTGFDVAGLAALPAVDILYGHQGTGAHLFDAALDAGVRGIVYAATGNGTLSEIAKRAAARARARGVVLVRATRVGSGSVSAHRVDAELATVAANSLNPQKARILLSLALTLTRDTRRIQQWFDRY